jgi:hypothetical protein
MPYRKYYISGCCPWAARKVCVPAKPLATVESVRDEKGIAYPSLREASEALVNYIKLFRKKLLQGRVADISKGKIKVGYK